MLSLAQSHCIQVVRWALTLLLQCKVWPEASYIFKKLKVYYNYSIIFVSFIIIFTKAVTYDKRPKMKRDTRQKSGPFLKKTNCFFVRSLSSFSAIRHNVTPLAAVLKTVLKSTKNAWPLNCQNQPQNRPNLSFCFIKRAHRWTLLQGVWPDYLFKILLQCNDMDISKGDAAVKPE